MSEVIILEEIKNLPEKRKISSSSTLKLAKQVECNECIFLRECNYIVKIAKLEISPYCFIDSPFHHRYVKEYGKIDGSDTVSE